MPDYYKKVVFCSSQIRSLVAIATFIFHRLAYNGKSENLLFLQSHWRYSNFIFKEMFIV